MGRAGRVNVKRKEVETRESIINQAQLRRPRGVRRRSKKLRRNVLDGADFVKDVRDTHLQSAFHEHQMGACECPVNIDSDSCHRRQLLDRLTPNGATWNAPRSCRITSRRCLNLASGPQPFLHGGRELSPSYFVGVSMRWILPKNLSVPAHAT